MKRSLSLSMLALAAAAGFSVNISAQVSAEITAQITARAPTCDDVVWSATLVELAPRIAKRCLEVVQRGEEWFARIEVKVVRHGVSSTVVRYRQADGNWSNAERSYAPRGSQAEVADQEISISETAAGQELNVYVSSQGGENFNIPMLEGTTTDLAPAAIIGPEAAEF